MRCLPIGRSVTVIGLCVLSFCIHSGCGTLAGYYGGTAIDRSASLMATDPEKLGQFVDRDIVLVVIDKGEVAGRLAEVGPTEVLLISRSQMSDGIFAGGSSPDTTTVPIENITGFMVPQKTFRYVGMGVGLAVDVAVWALVIDAFDAKYAFDFP